MTLSDELLPCPFCGERPSAGYTGNICIIECHSPACWGPAMRHFAVPEEAIAAWNRRASPHGEAGVTVEPLVWTDLPANSDSDQGLITLWYRVISIDGQWHVMLNGLAPSISQHDRRASAKAAAQADYEVRIRSASPGSSAGESIDHHAYRVAHVDPPSAPPQREGLEAASVVVNALGRAADFLLGVSTQTGTTSEYRDKALAARFAVISAIRALTGKGGE